LRQDRPRRELLRLLGVRATGEVDVPLARRCLSVSEQRGDLKRREPKLRSAVPAV
jgi:hypothetical protein